MINPDEFIDEVIKNKFIETVSKKAEEYLEIKEKVLHPSCNSLITGYGSQLGLSGPTLRYKLKEVQQDSDHNEYSDVFFGTDYPISVGENYEPDFDNISPRGVIKYTSLYRKPEMDIVALFDISSETTIEVPDPIRPSLISFDYTVFRAIEGKPLEEGVELFFKILAEERNSD